MKSKKALLCLLAFSLFAPAAAQPPEDLEYKPRTEFLAETSAPLTRAEAEAFFNGAGKDDRAIIVPVLIIMAGAKAWSVITNGRPSADLASAYASAIPGFQFNWAELTDWRKVTREYRFTLGNSVQGDTAVDITYEVSFFHGSIATPGSIPLRKGHYIANFIIKPGTIKLKWGWKVSLSALMSNPMNIGTSAEPVAMLNADLKWQYVKPFTSEPKIGMDSVVVDGLGDLQDSAGGRLEIAVPAIQEPAEFRPVTWD